MREVGLKVRNVQNVGVRDVNAHRQSKDKAPLTVNRRVYQNAGSCTFKIAHFASIKPKSSFDALE
ncbi:hypothetical protein D3C77_776400 [compost metagenome]